MIKNKRGDFEFSFAWIFAIIAGVFILILAVYGVIKFMNISKTEINAQSAMDIGILTNPLESGFESSKRVMLVTYGDIRIYTGCINSSTFGRQIIRTSEKTFDKWSEEEGIDVSFQNKYLYSKDPVEGKSFYLFSKPFEMPFKIADLIYITSTNDKYCFVNSPDDIEDEIKDLKGDGEEASTENFFLSNRESDCPVGSTIICFSNGGDNCDVYVSLTNNYVQKRNGRMYYQGDALMYAAIFSEKENYECQLDRLMNRGEQLFKMYQDKSSFVLQKTGCNSELDIELIQMLNLIKGFQDSQDVFAITTLADDMERINEYAECKLW